MKKIALVTVLIFNLLYLKSQSFSITTGEEFNEPQETESDFLIESDENNFYKLYQSKKNEAFLYAFDNKFGKIMFEKTITLEENQSIIKGFSRGGKVLLMIKSSPQKTNQIIYSVRSFNTENGNEIGETKVLHKIDIRKNEDLIYRNVYFEFSPNNLYLLFILEEKIRDQPRTLNSLLFELQTIKLIWQKKPVVEYENSKVFSFCFKTDNEKRLIYAGYWNDKKENEWQYFIAISDWDKNDTTFINCPTDKISTVNINLEFVMGNLICSGEYLDGNSSYKNVSRLENTGFFIFTINLKLGKIEHQNYSLLTKEIQENLHYKSKIHGYNKNLKFFNHYKTVYLNGSYYLINYHGYDFSIYNKSAGFSTYYYFSKDIIIFKYDEHLQYSWAINIPRCSFDSYSNYSGDNALNLVMGKNLHLFYYENPKNISAFPDVMKYDTKKYNRSVNVLFSKRVPVHTTINENGNMKRVVLSVTDEKFILSPYPDNLSYISKTAGLVIFPYNITSKKTRYDILNVIEKGLN